MAVQEVQGGHMGIYFRDAGSTGAYKKLVCEETLVFDLNNDVNTTKTKCGIFKGIQVADFKCSGTGMCNVTPLTTEMSHDQVQIDQIAITKKEFVIQNEAYGTETLGSAIKMAGEGYFTSSQINMNNGETVNFTWSMEGVGTPNVTES
jgi:hypothetical protein